MRLLAMLRRSQQNIRQSLAEGRSLALQRVTYERSTVPGLLGSILHPTDTPRHSPNRLWRAAARIPPARALRAQDVDDP